jgi:hypothetical protein
MNILAVGIPDAKDVVRVNRYQPEAAATRAIVRINKARLCVWVLERLDCQAGAIT